MNNRISRVKLNHWLNIRKTTLSVLNNLLKNHINFYLSLENLNQLDNHSVDKLAEVLSIPPSYILEQEKIPSYILNTKETIEKTKRPIQRGGIHFYNYYTLPSPQGYVAPVLIDILCPKERLPVLNKGHLEPAITISLGPNDIYARFAKKLNKETYLKFKINKEQDTNWVVGSSYFEPSYCLHTYSRATNGPGRILSYTTRSYLENLLGNKLNDNSFKNFLSSIKNEKINRTLLGQDIQNKGYSFKEISTKTKISLKKIKNFINGKKSNLDTKELSKICNVINSNSNLYLDKEFKEDSIGKLYYDYKDSLKTKRSFKSYEVASIANSSRFPDLFGYFIKVKNQLKKQVLDLMDTNCSHYLVSNGKIKFHVKRDKNEESIDIKEGDAIWISAYTKHGFTGKGSLIKISDGQNINYLEKIDLINTYNLKNTLARGRNDKVTWGYDA